MDKEQPRSFFVNLQLRIRFLCIGNLVVEPPFGVTGEVSLYIGLLFRVILSYERFTLSSLP